MTRPPGGAATHALVALALSLAAATVLGRACGRPVPELPGEVVQLVRVHVDAGARE